ncbi:DUF6266 family protein [Flavobacterium phycosphaerae]|uniref:DUF6266 family protein n=1 Tax=Flavobacterium phycosphaerae TaxID=2697515 RepID=UPI00138A5C64|nr:DUF6266 family protein [Flavobacterium phycosphaerae]
MATYNKGILGPFTGKVGTVVGANWRGKDVLRSLPKKTKRTPSETQRLQRERFLTATEFLTPINPVLGKYFGAKSGEKTRLNQAMSYHLKEAVVFQDPDFVIDYTKVTISKGDLPGLQNPEVVAIAGGKLGFTWEDNSGQGEAKADDAVIVVVYAPAAGLYYTQLETATRSGNTLGITLPAFFNGLEVQSWIGVTAADHKSNATSIPMGAVTVLA